MNQFEIEVINALRELEIPPHVKGYAYIISAMNYLQDNPKAIYAITKELYPDVAKLQDTAPSRVERAIRHAISLAKDADTTWHRVLGRVGPMTNGEFLASLNEAIKLKMATQAPAATRKAVKA